MALFLFWNLMTLEFITTASGPKWAGVDICWLQQLLQGLDATSVSGPGGTLSIRPGLIFSYDDRARSRLPRFPKCHWKCHKCVAMPAGERECACVSVSDSDPPIFTASACCYCCAAKAAGAYWGESLSLLVESDTSALGRVFVFVRTQTPQRGLKKKRGPGSLWRRWMSSMCSREFNALKRYQEGVASARKALPQSVGGRCVPVGTRSGFCAEALSYQAAP